MAVPEGRDLHTRVDCCLEFHPVPELLLSWNMITEVSRNQLIIIINKIHIINLESTVRKLAEALKFTKDFTSRKGSIMFVSTKRASREIIAEERKKEK